ncbi:DUF6850 family outer membrane beta-barrel protein [Parapedobacter sp. DT-150]|uniref:DUF6850 family outer membrane beta-barrel protein n=1 Tax=Parapedobacter sp. DT-150 TaxID=3396162 RepID=UPI003F19DE1F
MPRNLLLTGLLMILGASYTVCAQDTASRQLRVATGLSPYIRLLDGYYESPALKPFLREWSFAELSAGQQAESHDRYVYQKGSGYRRFGVDASSYIRQPQRAIWGQAHYHNERVFGVNYNETTDYDVLYPYVTADTVGGALQAEQYAFGGGYAWAGKRLHYGLSGSFRGEQAFRNRDPRLRAVVSDVSATAAMATPLGHRYLLAADLEGRRYTQSSKLEFVSEVGFPLIYHDAGLGVYNELLAGSRMDALYGGYGWGAALRLVPMDREGWFGHLHYRRFQFDKTLSGIVAPISEVVDDAWRLQGGYATAWEQNRLLIQLTASTAKRQGIEARFNNRDAETGMDKIDEALRFLSGDDAVALDMIYEHTGERLSWRIGGVAGYENHRLEYVQPIRYMSYSHLRAGLRLSASRAMGRVIGTATLGMERRQNVAGSHRWDGVSPESGIHTMLTGNYAYYSADQEHFSGDIRVDFPVSPKTNVYIKLGGRHIRYPKAFTGHRFAVSSGFLF